MDFEDSGIDSDPKIDSSLDFNSPPKANKPIISFSPDRSRFNIHTSTPTSSSIAIVADTILSLAEQPPVAVVKRGSLVNNERESTTSDLSSSGSLTSPGDNCIKSSTTTDLHKRLEKRIARANSTSGLQQRTSSLSIGNNETTDTSKITGKQNRTVSTSDHPQQQASSNIPIVQSSTLTTNNANGKAQSGSQQQTNNAVGTSSSSSSGFDTRKVPALIPPQRLAIPHKSLNSFNSNEGSSSENKPLVQWDSDDSEEELSFFPPPKNRGVLTDNLSIDNMSMSGEEDDLHLSPPRPIAQRCPCDPRLLFDSSSRGSSSTAAASTSSTKNCSIV